MRFWYLSRLRVILLTYKQSYLVGIEAFFSVSVIIYVSITCMRAAMVLVRLSVYTASSEPSLIHVHLNTKFHDMAHIVYQILQKYCGKDVCQQKLFSLLLKC